MSKITNECGFWYWKKEISPEICKKLISLGDGKWNTAHLLDSHKDSTINADSVRISDVVWVEEQWVFDLIWSYMMTANKNAGWKYDITAAESCQITRYTKNGFYTWHQDGIGSHNKVGNNPNNKFLYNNTRKLSMSILLNSDFKGGRFQLNTGANKNKIPIGQGTIIVFPSFLVHRVTPIIEGMRYSLVTWFVGPPFR
jgi:PKHD-type hydroxylase